MSVQVVNGAMLACSMGMAPSALAVLPKSRVLSSNQPAANIMDHVPMLNIQPFGMCTSPTNPQVAAATTAALGVLTPQPCIPVTPAPWAPGAPTVLIANMPALDVSCKLNCIWAGIISVTSPGQTTELVP